MIKKIFLSLFVALYLLTQFITPAKAETWFNQDPINWYKKVYDTSISPEPEIFGERYTAAQVQWIFYSVLFLPFVLVNPELSDCIFSGDLESCFSSFIAQNENQIELAETPPLPSVVEQIFTNKSLSGITYTKNVLKNLNIIPEAQAQVSGFGFSALDPVLALWRGSRNIAYSLLILVTIIMAFMIMFRVKISPQLVISVQSALPKVITAIILITFSYAIAGFLVDLMYVVIGLVSMLFTGYVGTFFGITTPAIFNLLTAGQPIGGINIGIFGLSIAYLYLFIIALGLIIVTTMGLISSALLNPVIGLVLFLVALIGFILLIIHIIRVIFMLIRAFTNILLLTIFAPFQILAGTLISSVGFGSWIKDFVANLSVFVVTGVLFLLSLFFLVQSMLLTIDGVFASGTPTFLGFVTFVSNLLFGTAAPASAFLHFAVNPANAVWPPLLGGGTSTAVGFLFLGVSFVLFTLIPRVSEVIQGFISGRQFAYGSAIGEATMAPIGTAIQGGSFLAKNAGYIQDFVNNTRRNTPVASNEPQVAQRIEERLRNLRDRESSSDTA